MIVFEDEEDELRIAAANVIDVRFLTGRGKKDESTECCTNSVNNAGRSEAGDR